MQPPQRGLDPQVENFWTRQLPGQEIRLQPSMEPRVGGCWGAQLTISWVWVQSQQGSFRSSPSHSLNNHVAHLKLTIHGNQTL